jgi:hypothetical protein
MRAEIASRSCSATADAYASLFSERPMRDMARRKAILVHAVRQGDGRDAVKELLKRKLLGSLQRRSNESW